MVTKLVSSVSYMVLFDCFGSASVLDMCMFCFFLGGDGGGGGGGRGGDGGGLISSFNVD